VLEHDEETIRGQVMKERIDRGLGAARVWRTSGWECPDALPYTPYCIQCERKVEAAAAVGI
jgi:hypothetical protein